MCVSECGFVHLNVVTQRPEEGSNPLGLEFLVNHQTWVPGTELGASIRTRYTLTLGLHHHSSPFGNALIHTCVHMVCIYFKFIGGGYTFTCRSNLLTVGPHG